MRFYVKKYGKWWYVDGYAYKVDVAYDKGVSNSRVYRERDLKDKFENAEEIIKESEEMK